MATSYEHDPNPNEGLTEHELEMVEKLSNASGDYFDQDDWEPPSTSVGD